MVAELEQLERDWAEGFVIEARDERGLGHGVGDPPRSPFREPEGDYGPWQPDDPLAFFRGLGFGLVLTFAAALGVLAVLVFVGVLP